MTTRRVKAEILYGTGTGVIGMLGVAAQLPLWAAFMVCVAINIGFRYAGELSHIKLV